MAISVSDYLEVERKVFEATGAFDAILDVDTQLFIDPYLLRYTEAPELEHSYEKVQKLFADVMKLLAMSQYSGDKFWREALARFRFGEMKGLCIGYSASGTSGSGMGPKLRRYVLRTAKTIIDAGIQDPEFFELLGLFERGIGADRISDMVGWIILRDLLAYSERIFAELEVSTVETKYGDDVYQLPRNEFNRYPIILIPRDVLRELPTANSWDAIDHVASENAALRVKVNELIARVWTDTSKQMTKGQLKEIFLEMPELLQATIDAYKELPVSRYDFETDPADQVFWYPLAKRLTTQNPLDVAMAPIVGIEDVLELVYAICNKFKDVVENNKVYTLLYRDENRKQPRSEESAQKLFFTVAESYCEANNLDITPEANAGRGPVGFKFSYGYYGRVLVEVKLTTNSHLRNGWELQIAEYQKAEKTKHAILLLIDVGGSRYRIKELFELKEQKEAVGERVPDIVLVDAKPKLSASQMRRRRR